MQIHIDLSGSVTFISIIMDRINKVLHWAAEKGINIHPDVIVDHSNLGGFGLIAQQPLKEDTVILRIPQKCTLDLSTLLELANAMKNADKTGTVTKIINLTLTNGSNFTETAIIRNYIWALRILQGIRSSNTLNVVGIERVDQYLDVLADTQVLDVDEQNDCSDNLVQSQIEEKRKVAADFTELIQKLPEVKSVLTFKQAFQLHQAVKSRVLEIPHAIEKVPTDGDGEDEENGSENFTTNVTLVPVLDFANHKFDKNAIFDVDRDTEDVILRLEKDVATGDEVCISYSPTKALDVFFRTYGFVPDSEGFFKWKLPHLNEVISQHMGGGHQNYDYIAKWLHIYTYLFVIQGTNDAIWLDLTNFKLPLLMIPGLKYNKDWALKVNAEELSHMYDGTLEEIVGELRMQEEESDVVYGPEIAYGVTWNDKEVSISSLIEQALGASEDGGETLIKSTIPVIRSAIVRSLREDEETARQSDNLALKGYYAHKKKLLERISVFELADYMQMIEGANEIED